MLEAICFQTLDVLRAMAADAGAAPLRVLFVDGGASQNALLLQMQADLLQVRAPCGRTAAPRLRLRARHLSAAGLVCKLGSPPPVVH